MEGVENKMEGQELWKQNLPDLKYAPPVHKPLELKTDELGKKTCLPIIDCCQFPQYAERKIPPQCNFTHGEFICSIDSLLWRKLAILPNRIKCVTYFNIVDKSHVLREIYFFVPRPVDCCCSHTLEIELRSFRQRFVSQMVSSQTSIDHSKVCYLR